LHHSKKQLQQLEVSLAGPSSNVAARKLKVAKLDSTQPAGNAPQQTLLKPLDVGLTG
jgi:hypothetical protein